MLLSLQLSVDTKRLVAGVGLVGGGLAVAASFSYRYRRSTGRRRIAWGLFAWAGALATTSNLILVLFPETEGVGPMLSNIGLSVGLLIGIAGLVTFPLKRHRGTDLTRMVLDGIVIGGSILFAASVTLFPDIVGEAGAAGAVALAVPIADIVLATLATLLFLRGDHNDRPALGLVAVGFSCSAASDFAYALARDSVSVLASPLSLGWIAGYAMIALAVRVPGTAATAKNERPAETSPLLGTAVTFTLFLGAAVLGLYRLDSVPRNASIGLWVLVLLAVIARQIILIVDNEHLRRTLERRVIDRSNSLLQVTEQTDLLLNSVGDGIYGVDRDGLVTFVNPAAARALGHDPQTLIGRDAHATFHATSVDGTAFPKTDCYITEAIRDGLTTSAEDDSYLCADGRPIPVEVTATPLYANGGSAGAVVVFRDVTQRREVDRMKSEFVSMVSHELRTPLTAIRGSLGLLSGGALGPLSASADRMVEIALISSERLTRLIDEILDIERIESGVISVKLADHSARSLIDSALGQLQLLAAEAQVRVVVGPVFGVVRADADQVVQTLLNLLGNAIKFTLPATTVQVSAEPRGAEIEFAITDQGRGIPDDKLDSIFGRFEQVDSSDAREKGGSGLGLAISRSLVKRLGGRIWATNNAGPGATFWFTLPRAGAVDPPADLPANLAADPSVDREAIRSREWLTQ